MFVKKLLTVLYHLPYDRNLVVTIWGQIGSVIIKSYVMLILHWINSSGLFLFYGICFLMLRLNYINFRSFFIDWYYGGRFYITSVLTTHLCDVYFFILQIFFN